MPTTEAPVTTSTEVLPVEEIEVESLVIPGDDAWEMLSRGGDVDGPYIVILYNCRCHTYEQVIVQLMKATQCSRDKALAIATEVDTKGRAIAFSGSQEECDRVAKILRQIRLQVETDKAV